MPYVVQITRYEDDYKHRYDNGVYPNHPVLFKSEDKAQQYVCQKIFDAICEHIDDQEIKIYKEDKKYFMLQEDSNTTIKDKYKNDYKILSKLHKTYLKGKFVDYKVDWTIEEVEYRDE